jgi:hypothetical protein
MMDYRKGLGDGGPAFAHGHPAQGGDRGMSLRDYFAGQALSGLLAGGFADTVPHDSIHPEADFYAYKYADEMLRQRNK